MLKYIAKVLLLRFKYLFIICIHLVLSANLSAQDIQFSQFYENPLYLNPAFAGGVHHYRAIVHNRLQWPSLDANYNTYLFSFDKYFNYYQSGIGLMVLRDYQGHSSIKSTEVALQYSYELHLTSQYTIRAGLQGSYMSRALDYSRQTFPDQYTDQGIINGAISGDQFSQDVIHFADFSSGTVFYSDKFWFAGSVHHMNNPRQSFLANDPNSRLPLKYSFMSGYKIPVIHKKIMAYLEDEPDISITPTIHYKMQGKSDQLDLGAYIHYDQLLAAVWYRGIPVKKYESRLHNNESMVFTLGWRYGSFNFSYSYDWTVSKLVQARTGGAHELNITFIHHKAHKGVKEMRKLPCPHFHKDNKHYKQTHHQQHHRGPSQLKHSDHMHNNHHGPQKHHTPNHH